MEKDDRVQAWPKKIKKMRVVLHRKAEEVLRELANR